MAVYLKSRMSNIFFMYPNNLKENLYEKYKGNFKICNLIKLTRVFFFL